MAAEPPTINCAEMSSEERGFAGDEEFYRMERRGLATLVRMWMWALAVACNIELFKW